MADSPRPSIDTFLTPEAMLTPGAAGALTMMITNAVALNFDTHRAFTGLVISCLFGAMVFVAVRSFWQKSLYYVLNTLIIFCVALGANAVGVTKVTSLSPISPAFAGGPEVNREGTLRSLLQDEEKISALRNAGASSSTIRELEEAQRNRIRSLGIEKAPSNTFFKPWLGQGKF